jgi:hypothetical protein
MELEKKIQELHDDMESMKKLVLALVEQTGVEVEEKKEVSNFDLFLNLSRLFKFFMDSNNLFDEDNKVELEAFRKVFNASIDFLELKGYKVTD